MALGVNDTADVASGARAGDDRRKLPGRKVGRSRFADLPGQAPAVVAVREALSEVDQLGMRGPAAVEAIRSFE